MSNARVASQIVICLGALMCLLGATWLDIITQHRSGRSAWDSISPTSVHAKLIETESGIALAFRGTVLDKESLQTDLAIGFNNALPLVLFGITPLYPPSFMTTFQSIGLPVPVIPNRSIYIIITVWWITAMALVAIGGRLFLNTAPISERVLYYCLAALLAGLPLEYLAIGNLHNVPLILSISLLASYFLAAAILLSAVLLPFTQRLTAGPTYEDQIESASLVLVDSTYSLIFLGVFSLGALWLGWYTYDTRMNLLEQTPDMAGQLTVVLLAATLAIIRNGPARRFLVITVLALVALIIATFPLPERLSDGMQYVLLNSNEVEPYESTHGPVHQIAEQHYALYRHLTSSWPLTFETDSFGGWNSANLYSHIPMPVSWLRPLAMIVTLGSLAGVFVFIARAFSRLLQSVWCIVGGGSRRGRLSVIVVGLVVFCSFVVVFDRVKRSVVSHEIERLLLLAPKPLVDLALPSYLAYFSDEREIPEYVRTYLDELARLDEEVRSSATAWLAVYLEYLSAGATDWMSFGWVEELDRKLELLDQLDELITAELEKRRGFCERLLDRLTRSGAERELAGVIAKKWSAWLNDIVELGELQSAEVDLHRKYIRALASSPVVDLRPVANGTVVLRRGGRAENDLPMMKLQGFEATLEVFRAREKKDFAFLSASTQRILQAQSNAGIARIVEAYTAFLRCFASGSAFSVRPGEDYIVWHDGVTDVRCRDATERVLRAKRGDL